MRLGISLMAPGHNTIDLWQRVHACEPDLRLQIVPVGDLYSPRDSVMTRLGDKVDVVQTSYSTVRWGGSCRLLPLFSSTPMVDVLRSSDFAGRRSAVPADLSGMRVRVLRHGNDALDDVREVLLATPGVEVVDVDRFDFDLFNDAAEKGDAVMTSGAWSGIHPGFTGVPLLCGCKVPCFLTYPQKPSPQVQRFVEAMRSALEQ